MPDLGSSLRRPLYFLYVRKKAIQSYAKQLEILVENISRYDPCQTIHNILPLCG